MFVLYDLISCCMANMMLSFREHDVSNKYTD